MAGVFLDEIDELLGILTEAVRTRDTVRAYLREPDGSERPTRIVEGRVVEVADGRDGRTRVRFSIASNEGEPVEVRVLVEGIERAELVAASGGPVASASGAMLRPSVDRIARTATPRISWNPVGSDDTATRRSPPKR